MQTCAHPGKLVMSAASLVATADAAAEVEVAMAELTEVGLTLELAKTGRQSCSASVCVLL